MKKLSCILVCCLFFSATLTLSTSYSQNLEKETTQELSKDARKGELYNFQYDEDSKSYTLVFKREKKKKNIYEIYEFDYDLKMTNNETLEEDAAVNKYKAAKIDVVPEDPWNDPTVVRVDPTLGGNIVLRQGTLTREWTKSVEEKGNYIYTTWYWKYNFNETKEVTPKFEGLVDIPEGAPKLVIKMAQKAATSVKLIGYATDEPGVEITTGKQNFVYGSLWARKKDYAAASGDILVIGRSDQMNFDTKIPKQVYLAMQFAAEDLSEKARTNFEFEYENSVVYQKVLSDGTMMMVFAPVSYPGLKNKSPNPTEWEYVRINKDATIKDRVKFESKGGWWAINNAILTENDEVLIYGLGSVKKANKHYNSAAVLNKFDNVTALKIGAGSVVYNSSVDLKQMAGKMHKPGNQKKAKAYAGKDMNLDGNFALTSSGDIIFTGQAVDRSSIYAFHYGAGGDFKAHYVVGLENQSKEQGIDLGMFENLDNKTITFFVAEIEGVNKGRVLKIPRMASIDIAGATISDFEIYGYGKKGKFYLDDGFPFTFIDERGKVVFFSRDGKDKNIWLGRIKLGSN